LRMSGKKAKAASPKKQKKEEEKEEKEEEPEEEGGDEDLNKLTVKQITSRSAVSDCQQYRHNCATERQSCRWRSVFPFLLFFSPCCGGAAPLPSVGSFPAVSRKTVAETVALAVTFAVACLLAFLR
jgi:hypothetical protein